MPIYTAKDVHINERDLSPSLRFSKFAKLSDNKNKKGNIDFLTDSGGYNSESTPRKSDFKMPNSISFKMKLGGRMMINQAGGIHENANLCIHRHFGYPYIPGSALKGIAGHAAWQEWLDNPSILEQIIRVFGFPTNNETLDNESKKRNIEESSGTVVFFEAKPESSCKLVTDVLTCHHMDYYAGRQENAYDNESPNPQFFPAVEKGAVFRFYIGRTQRTIDSDLQQALKWLKTGLSDNGAGSKTSAGYGWFKEV